MVQKFIDNCDKTTWTEKQKAHFCKKARQTAVGTTKAIRSHPQMRGARLKVLDWPEAINAGCLDGLNVSVDGLVTSHKQKTILWNISAKYSDNEVKVVEGAIGMGAAEY